MTGWPLEWAPRDVWALRTVRRDSHASFGGHIGASGETVRRWESGGQPPTHKELLRKLDATLATLERWQRQWFDELRLGVDGGPAPHWDVGGDSGRAGVRAKRRDAVKLIGMTAVAPTVVTQVAFDAVAEAMEFTRGAEASSLGSGTLEQVEMAVAGFNQAYTSTPPAGMFDTVRQLRRYVAHLIGGRHTLREGRALYTYAGWLSELLAWLAHDLGNPIVAEAYCGDAWQHGSQAEHDELCGWAMDARASIALYDNRPEIALSAALRGAEQAPAGHPLSVRLTAQAARAHARLGQREEFMAAFRQATELHERLGSQTPTRFGLDTQCLASYAVTSYAASSCIWLGLAEEARQHAEDALCLYAAAPAASRSPSREAIARIDLALALSILGSPDEACALGMQALSSERVVDSIRVRASDLDASLRRSYPQLPEAQEFHELLAHVQPDQLPPEGTDQTEQQAP